MRVEIAYKIVYNGHLYIHIHREWYCREGDNYTRIKRGSGVYLTLENLLRNEALDV